MADQWPRTAPVPAGKHGDARDDNFRPITLAELDAEVERMRRRRVLPLPKTDPALEGREDES